jgi:hypothetical protein
MIVTTRQIFLAGVLAHVAAGALIFAAVAQNAPDPPLHVAPATEPQVPPPGEPQQRSSSPGLFGAIGRWVDDSIGAMTSGFNTARETVGGLGDRASDAAKGAAGAVRDAATVMRIPAGWIVTGRGHCVRTASGGPDCQAATDMLCRSKGYSTGTSLHIQSEQKCPVWGWIAGREPVGQCGTETYVTQAMCR